MDDYKPLYQRYQDQFDFYKKAHDALITIPNDYRSRNHTEYLNELDERLYGLEELIRRSTNQQKQ